MIIHIAPWSNDPPREPGLLLFFLSLSLSFPLAFPPLCAPPPFFRPGLRRCTRLFGRAVVRYYCPAIQVHPYLSAKKGEFLSAANEFARRKKRGREDSITPHRRRLAGGLLCSWMPLR